MWGTLFQASLDMSKLCKLPRLLVCIGRLACWEVVVVCPCIGYMKFSVSECDGAGL